MGNCCTGGYSVKGKEYFGRSERHDIDDDESNLFTPRFVSERESKEHEMQLTFPYAGGTYTTTQPSSTQAGGQQWEGHQNWEEGAISDPLSCSSTTVDTVPHEHAMRNRLRSDSLSVTLPEVSATTVSTRLDHPRTMSYIDSDDDMSVDWSPGCKRDGRVLTPRKSLRAMYWDVAVKEMDQRRFLVEYFNRSYRALLASYIRRTLEIERNHLYKEYIKDRSAFLLGVLQAMEPLVRRSIESNARSELIHRLRQEGVD